MTGTVVAPLPAAIIAGAVLSNTDTTLRLRTDADLTFLRGLFDEDRRPQFAGLPDAVLTALLDQQFHARETGYRHAFPAAGFAVIAQRGQAVGEVIIASGFDAGACILRLVDITIAGDARGRGIGADVITALARSAHAQGATELQLSVLSANAAARRLYDRLGFAARGDDGARVAMTRPLP